MITDVFGFPVTEASNDGGDFCEVDLGDAGGKIVLAREDFLTIARDSSSAEDFAFKVANAKTESKERWQRERGPDSELGRNMEAGTPRTSHGD